MQRCRTLPDIALDVWQARGVATTTQKRWRRPRVRTITYGRRCSGITLGTLESCRRPPKMTPDELVLVLVGNSDGGDGKVVLDVTRTRKRSRNTRNAKTLPPGPPRAGPGHKTSGPGARPTPSPIQYGPCRGPVSDSRVWPMSRRSGVVRARSRGLSTHLRPIPSSLLGTRRARS